MQAGNISPHHSPAHYLCEIPAARRGPRDCRRVLVADTSVADPLALQPTCPTSELMRPFSARSDRVLLESSLDPKAGRHPQASDPPRVPSGAGAAQIPPTLFFILSMLTRPPRSLSGTHRSHRRTEAPQSRFGCPHLAQQISRAFGIDSNKNVVHHRHEKLIESYGLIPPPPLWEWREA